MVDVFDQELVFEIEIHKGVFFVLPVHDVWNVSAAEQVVGAGLTDAEVGLHWLVYIILQIVNVEKCSIPRVVSSQLLVVCEPWVEELLKENHNLGFKQLSILHMTEESKPYWHKHDQNVQEKLPREFSIPFVLVKRAQQDRAFQRDLGHDMVVLVFMVVV